MAEQEGNEKKKPEKMIFDIDCPNDILRLQSCLLNNDVEENRASEDDSDTSDVEQTEERVGDSETEQSGDSSDEEDGEENSDFFVAYQKKRGKVVNEWKWKKKPLNQRRRRGRQNILLHLPGVKGPAKNISSVAGTWKCLIDDDKLNLILTSTNKYISSIQNKYSRPRDARLTDVIEIKAFIGLLYLAGVYKANRMDREELWSTIDRFREVMSVKRFSFLSRYLRFDDIETRRMRTQYDRLAPIRELFEKFIQNYQACYSLGENVTIDEKLEGFRGRCTFIQYIPSKPNKYGIKIYALVDSRIFYTFNLEIYPGEQPEGPFTASNSPFEVVKRMVAPIIGSERNLTTDNWFTSYDLVNYLTQEKLSFVGTLKKNKAQIPLKFKNVKKQKQFTSTFGFQENATLVSYVPRLNRNVILISSLHNDDAIDPDTGDRKKPEIITFYNMTKGG